MTRIRYTRRLGQNPAGTARDVTGSNALWLVQRGYAVYEQQPAPQASRQQESTATDQDPQQEPGAEDSKSLSLADLKARAEKLGVATYGSKAQLLDRIEQAEQSQGQSGDTDEGSGDPEN